MADRRCKLGRDRRVLRRLHRVEIAFVAGGQQAEAADRRRRYLLLSSSPDRLRRLAGAAQEVQRDALRARRARRRQVRAICSSAALPDGSRSMPAAPAASSRIDQRRVGEEGAALRQIISRRMCCPWPLSTGLTQRASPPAIAKGLGGIAARRDRRGLTMLDRACRRRRSGRSGRSRRSSRAADATGERRVRPSGSVQRHSRHACRPSETTTKWSASAGGTSNCSLGIGAAAAQPAEAVASRSAANAAAQCHEIPRQRDAHVTATAHCASGARQAGESDAARFAARRDEKSGGFCCPAPLEAAGIPFCCPVGSDRAFVFVTSGR